MYAHAMEMKYGSYVRESGEAAHFAQLMNTAVLIEVPYVVHVKVHVLSFNMILISSP